jgi:diguanylate cyclase (GGDEF)-like protein
MGHVYNLNQQFVLNERWLFDATHGRLADLEGRVETVTLQPVATRILSLFVQAPRIVQRRRQLLDDGWRAFGFEVCENSLNQVIHMLRSAFGQLDPNKAYLRTVPRIGYCLLADVRPAGEADRTPHVSESVTRTGAPPQAGVTGLPEVTSRFIADGTGLDDARPTQENSAPLSLLLIDVDQLRHINGLYGRTAGDSLLSAVEQCIGRQLQRRGDCVVRHDGALFVARLSDTDQAGAVRVAARIRNAIHTLDWRSRDGTLQTVTLSIGFACASAIRFSTADAFVRTAAAAFRQANQNGANQAVSHDIDIVLPVD